MTYLGFGFWMPDFDRVVIRWLGIYDNIGTAFVDIATCSFEGMVDDTGDDDISVVGMGRDVTTEVFGLG